MSEVKQDLYWLLDGLSDFKEESIDESRKQFKNEVDLIDFIAAVLGSLAFFTMKNKTENNLLISDSHPSTDWKFHAHITDLINTLLSIKELCINGFDTQARSLVRVFDERIYQNLILFSSSEDYVVWETSESSREAHYDLFSKRKSIFKKIRVLEERYLDQKNSDELILIRKETEGYYSDSIHGASISVIAGSVAYPFGDLDDGPFVSALYGRASSCSFQTLHHCIGQMAYFVTMINLILEDLHLLKSINGDELIDTFRKNHASVMEKSINLILSEKT